MTRKRGAVSESTTYRCCYCGLHKVVVAGNHHPRCVGCHGDDFDWANPIEPAAAPIKFNRAGSTINAKNWVTFNVWHEDADRAEALLKKGS